MSISRLTPPLEYLRAASRTSLQSFELARLNHAANLRREIGVLLDQWIQETSEATLARWILDHHKALHASSTTPETTPTFGNEVTDLFPLPPAPSPEIVPAPPRFAATQPLQPSAQKTKAAL